MSGSSTGFTFEGRLVNCASFSFVGAVADPALETEGCFRILNIVYGVGLSVCWFVCCHVLDHHLIVDIVESFLEGRSGVLDK